MKKIFFIIALVAFIGCKKDNKTEEPEITTEEIMEQKSDKITTVEGGFSEVALSEKMMGVDGVEYNLHQVLQRYKGKVVVIDIWASWCPDCIKGMPKVLQLQSEFNNVVYLFLSYDKTEHDWRIGMDKYKTIGENFLMKSPWKTGNFKNEINLDWIPRYMVVDKTGKIALHRAIEADDPKLIETLKELTQ